MDNITFIELRDLTTMREHLTNELNTNIWLEEKTFKKVQECRKNITNLIGKEAIINNNSLYDVDYLEFKEDLEFYEDHKDYASIVMNALEIWHNNVMHSQHYNEKRRVERRINEIDTQIKQLVNKA